ncbi:carotenoid oxygenase family protein [Microcoleus sp. MON1_C1]|uniref:carotenoid oxygenase family protein n=1 Tax=Microcoleus sp. MON1_C1 TaxID=2818827 RepID=UPI002FD043EA
MNQSVENDDKVEKNSSFPRSVLSVSRVEFGLREDNPEAKYCPLKLLVKDGKQLPSGLQGHVFIISATGSVDSKYRDDNKDIVFPSRDGFTPFYNGDGMVYRFDFDNLEEGVFLTTRIAKTPCYYADAATNKCQPNLRFKNRGIMRMSDELGIRNQLNTGFLPMKFSQEDNERLLITWDIGRPYEIDTKTLEAVTPVGWDRDWRAFNPLLAKLPLQPPFPFKLVQTSAHPCFDENTGEMFTVNSGRSLSTFIAQLRPVLYWAFGLIDSIRNPSPRGFQKAPDQKNFFQKLAAAFKQTIHLLWSLLQSFNIFANFVYVISWDGKEKINKWQVTHPNGCPIAIKQSMHQIGLTEDYVVLMDTAFKFLLEEILPAPNEPKYEEIEKWLSNLIDRPQLPDSTIYIVRRTDLKSDVKKVVARQVVIPRETTHFLTDYKNPNDQITLHLAHVCAWDVAEWIREIDFSNSDNNGGLPHMFGMTVGPLDISRMGCYVLDAKDAKQIKVARSDLTGVYADNQPNKYCQDTQTNGKEYCKYTWGPALYAYRENPPSGHFENIYWSFFGCWEDIFTEEGFQMYQNYKYREIPADEVRQLTKKGIKSNLLRLHIADLDTLEANENRLQIQDAYEFDTGYFGNSPQFVPRAGGTGGSTDGYIVCVVYNGTDEQPDNGNEIWIFDAADLKSGPLCKLWHPQLNFGISVHTTWLSKIGKRTASYNIPVKQDYEYLVKQQPQEIQEFFNEWVYPKRVPKDSGDCSVS